MSDSEQAPGAHVSDDSPKPVDREFAHRFAQRHLERAFAPPELLRTEFNGLVFRNIGDTLVGLKTNHTFHEFCLEALKVTFGQEWLDQQFSLAVEEGHVVAKWLLAYSAQTKRETPGAAKTGETFHAVAAGGTKHAVMLGRDLLYLQNSGRLPDALLNRLRHRSEFQGAWYEVTVASALMHGGFDIEWLSKKSETHCEFVAHHGWTGERLAVETKSKRHPGIMNEPGDKPDELPARAHRNFRDALKKDPEGLPFAIFIDVNMPPSASFAQAESDWAGHMDSVIGSHGEHDASPASFSIACCTNFTWHHAPDEPVAGPAVVYWRVPRHARAPIANELTLRAIQHGIIAVAAMPPLNL